MDKLMTEDWYVYPRQDNDETPLTLKPAPPWRNFADPERLEKRGQKLQP